MNEKLKLRIGMCLFIAMALAASPASAQFSSGSSGADGALDLTGETGVVVLDPTALGIDPEGDNIFHFTSITIPADVTLALKLPTLPNYSVQMLSIGPIVILGEIDIRGGDGHGAGIDDPVFFSVPGPGGFAGGTGARPPLPAVAGQGPGVRFSGTRCADHWAKYGNKFILPLRGGSGGGGGGTTTVLGGGGSAGGGALLLASDVSIQIDGTIDAQGGTALAAPSGLGGSGSGGAIRLVAPIVSGSGVLNVQRGPHNGGPGLCFNGSAGWIRIEATSRPFDGQFIVVSFALSVVGLSPATTVLTDKSIFLGSLSIISIAGEAVVDPEGTFYDVDVTFDTPTTADIVIVSSDVPDNTTVKVQIFNETLGVPDTNCVLTDNQCTATATFPSGFSRVQATASWTP